MIHGVLSRWTLLFASACAIGAWGEAGVGFDFIEHPSMDFPAGRCGGHAPTGVAWTAPRDSTVTIQLAVWRFRSGPATQLSLWVEDRKIIDRANVTGTSLSPSMLSEGNAALRDIALRAAETVFVQIEGNDFVGLDFSVVSADTTWDLAKDFNDQQNPAGPWTYGRVSGDAQGAPSIKPYDAHADDFDPADFEQGGQGAWHGTGEPWFCSMMKSAGKTAIMPEVRYTTERSVYVEGLVKGSWVGRYWSADGRINVAYERAVVPAFRLAIDGEELEDGWRFVSAREVPAENSQKHVMVELSHMTRDVDVKLHTQLDGTPVMTRWIEVVNRGAKAVAITEIRPWTTWLAACTNFWGANPRLFYKEPFSLGYFTKSGHCWEGWFDWTPVALGKTTLGCDKGQCFDDPFFIIRNEGTGEYLIGDLAWSANWRMDLEYDQEHHNTLRLCIGPWASAALRVIPAGQSATSPAVHMARIAGDLDATVHAMHDHVRRSVLPSRTPERAYRTQYAVPGDQGYLSPSFGNPAGCTEAALKEHVDIAEALGAELFIMDAWWWDQQGDWTPSKERFPRGLGPLADYVHSKGMLFGLYAEIEKASPGSKISAEHPEWLAWLNPWPILDLSQPEPAAWMESQIVSLIEGCKLDLFRLDFNIPSEVPLEGATALCEGIPENRWWRYYETFSDIFRRIHARYPNVVLQQAACGGGRNDLATVGLFNESYLTDGLRMPYEFQNYSGQTLHLPPEIVVIAHGADAGGGYQNVENFDAYLRLTFTLGTPWIFQGMAAPSLHELSDARRQSFLHYGKIYKEFIRPLLPTCRVYHHDPVSARGGVESTPWFAMEFTARERDKAWATIVRIANRGEDTYVFKPRGLNLARDYRVTLDNSGDTLTMTGIELARDGIPLRLESVGQSELIMMQAE